MIVTREKHKNKLYYKVEDDGEWYNIEYYEAEQDICSAAEEAADDYFKEHGGWECSWPLDFKFLYIGNDNRWKGHLFTIKIEMEPRFQVI